MIDDILSEDLNKCINNIEETQTIINRIYYSEHLIMYFRKPFISLISTALSYILNNLKIAKVNYTAKMNSKDE